MLINMIDKKIRHAFSDAAMHYDMLTSLHKEIGRELTKKIMNRERCEAVLDVGMGTGWFTRRLTQFFPDATVIGLDFADGMIHEAQKGEQSYKIVQAHAAQLPFKENVFDIITSNLAYQWIEDLPEAFELCRSRLRADGLLSCTMFGHDTFCELFATLNECSGYREQVIRRLASSRQVEKSLCEAGLRSVNVSSEHIKVRFADMMHLVKWVKSIGANTLPKDFYVGKELLSKANEYYNAHYRDRLGIFATFEVIWVEASK